MYAPLTRKFSCTGFFIANSRIHTLMREFDWSTSPLGYPYTWAQSLRHVVRFMLDCKTPMAFSWGPDFRMIYNDAYLPIVGKKHPAAFGARIQDICAEIWPYMDRI